MQTIYEWIWKRIDTRLSKQFSYSRNFFHHIINRWGVLVNNKCIKKSYKLKNKDQIFIDNIERYLSPIILEEAPNIEIPILIEKEDYLIINKPKGILSHPNSIRDVKQPSVVWFLYHHFKDLPSYGNFIRAGLIHRLDKDTDGIMIIAKTEKGLQHFKQLFQKKSESKTIEEKEVILLQKFYKTKVKVTEQGKKFLQEIKKGWLPHYIVEDVIAKVPNTTPKEGITKIENIVLFTKENTEDLKGEYATLTLQILTGRTHQIRYHLSHHWLPIIGDYLYWTEEETPMQLSAYKLLYQDIDGKTKTIEIPKKAE